MQLFPDRRRHVVVEHLPEERMRELGIVAVIDTGIDPSHPAFANVLIPGYDFTRNSAGGSERNDVSQWDNSSQPQPAQVGQSTMAVVDPYNATMLSRAQYAAFGHGTMVAGIIHLVAPAAKIMGLKAFNADGVNPLGGTNYLGTASVFSKVFLHLLAG